MKITSGDRTVNRQRAVARARSYSIRHQCKVDIEYVLKGYAKGNYETRVYGERGGANLWHPGTITEIYATYENGVKIKSYGKPKQTSHDYPKIVSLKTSVKDLVQKWEAELEDLKNANWDTSNERFILEKCINDLKGLQDG